MQSDEVPRSRSMMIEGIRCADLLIPCRTPLQRDVPLLLFKSNLIPERRGIRVAPNRAILIQVGPLRDNAVSSFPLRS